jgi:hypothetical protein
VTARVRTDAIRNIHHQRRDLYQSTYLVPLERSGLILLSEEALDKELAIETSDKGAYDVSPTMSKIGECSPSIAQTKKTQSSKQICSSEGEIVRARVSATSK